jgi:hypothetical protein
MIDKKPKDMNEDEYREYYFKSKYWMSKHLAFRVLKALYVFQFKFVKQPLDWQVKRRLNPYHPLTYPIVLFTVVGVMLYGIFDTFRLILPEIKSLFRYE